MTEKYKDEVRFHYQQMRASAKLSYNLLYPTPAKLREECLLKFKDGCKAFDLKTLRSFVRLATTDMLQETDIQRLEPDRFKPILNCIKKGTNTAEHNIELLAWLTNFQPRPYQFFTDTKFINSVAAKESHMKPYPEYSNILDIEQSGQNKVNHNIAKVNHLEQQEAELEVNDLLKSVNIYTEERAVDQCPITIEYPSGVKLSIETNDLDLISKLVRI